MRASINADVATLTPPAGKAARAGRILTEMGKLTAADVDAVLRLQNEKNLRFGEAAALLGLVNEQDMQQVLFRQFGHSALPDGQEPYSRELVSAYHPESPNVEVLRAVRSQLMLHWFGRGKKALCVTGVNSGDGASYLAANLAVLFSQLGENTLLVDANLRRPHQHNIFNLTARYGLADLLAERAGMEAIVPVPHFSKLSVLAAGTRPPNPQDLISGARFAGFYQLIADGFDVVLYDMPAFSLGADAISAAANAGAGVLLAARRHGTRVGDIHAVSDRLTSSGIDIVGSVLFDR